MSPERTLLLPALCTVLMAAILIACGRTPTQPAAARTATAVPPEAVPKDTAVPAPTDAAVHTKTAQPEDTAAPAPSATIPSPPPAAASSPTAPPAAASLAGQHISYGGIEFTIDPLLQPVVELQSESMGKVPFVHFAFSSESPLCREGGCIEVYPVDAYESAYGQVYFPPQGPGGGAAILLKAGEKMLAFQNGEGTRRLEMHGQMGYYANNENLMYVFRGFTQDENFAVFIQIPLDADILLSSADPQHNTNPYALPVPEGSSQMDYNAEAARQLDLLTADEFTPHLDPLDALVASMHIEALPHVEGTILLETPQALE